MNHLTYTHYAKPADVWKHLALCEVLVNERPRVYVDTNAACAEYSLTQTPEQQYGIYHFMDKANDTLLQSAYYLSECQAVQENKYLGSPGLAMNILGNRAECFIFYDLEIAALANIAAFANRQSLWERTRTIRQDSIPGTLGLLPGLPSGTFIHFDPYTIDQPSTNGRDYLDVFVQAAERGLKCLLWYGFNTLEEKRHLNEFIKNKLASREIGSTTCVELIMDIIQEDTILCNPGILGNGLLTCNLFEETTSVLLKYSEQLVELYKDSRYNGFKGSMYRDIIL